MLDMTGLDDGLSVIGLSVVFCCVNGVWLVGLWVKPRPIYYIIISAFSEIKRQNWQVEASKLHNHWGTC